jgi:Tfp pilus assembly protein PilV
VRGVTLIEALVAMLITAIGMVALLGLQGKMRRSADFAKQRSEAVRLASEDLERLRAYSVLQRGVGAPAAVRGFDQIQPAVLTDLTDNINNARFTLVRRVTPMANGSGSQVDVEVSWEDRAGVLQSLSLFTFISRVEPKLSAALSIAPDGDPNRRPGGRSSQIPLEAKDLGDGRSVLKPPNSGGIAWVFNNLSGRITKRCTGFAADTQTSAITVADVATFCTNSSFAYLLSGQVRFSLLEPPSPEAPRSAALPLDMLLTLSSAGHPNPAYECFDDAPSNAVNAQLNGVRYYCAVFPNADPTPHWSGVLRLNGIVLGPHDYKVCRYSADYDGDGSIRNAEHPFEHREVAQSLGGQNFLVVLGSSACPAGQTADPEAGRFFNSATVDHQV